MTKSIKREEYTLRGRRVTLDTAQLSPGVYETMLFRSSDGLDIEVKTARTEAEALEQYASIRAAYPPDSKCPAPAPDPLTGKYAKLRDDLRAALQAGREAEAANPEDGGTCNFDSASLCLPRWSFAKVEQAAKEAGTNCFKWKAFGHTRLVFRPDTRGQGNARSRNAEAMTAALSKMGYDALDYCQMD